MKEKQEAILEQTSLFDKKDVELNKKKSTVEISEKGMTIFPNREVLQPSLPADVLKNRSNLIDEVIKSEVQENIESQEDTRQYPFNVTTRFSLSYEQHEGLNMNLSVKLSQFDREVMDAVATLAPLMSVLSAATIYRVITGKTQNSSVTKSQKTRVTTSMSKCRSCLINIDVSEEFKEYYGIGPKESLSYNEYLISYAEVRHKSPSGDNVYYEIMKMPPLFRFAESIGKISKIPLRLLDTPLSKTDGILAMQSYLLRSIDEMKSNDLHEIAIEWSKVYYYADVSEGDRVQKKRVRDNAKKVLEWWIKEGYIVSYSCDMKTNINLMIYD